MIYHTFPPQSLVMKCLIWVLHFTQPYFLILPAISTLKRRIIRCETDGH